jgi:SOS-response transcriptional repressor LexA
MQAHLLRTPRDVRAVFVKLLGDGGAEEDASAQISQFVRKALDDTDGKSAKAMENAVPIVNRASAGYPKDFVDLDYPSRVAQEHVSCPDLSDQNAFAARVQGQSMTPKYADGDIVIFSPSLAARNGDDCFVRFADGQTTFQRVFFESDEQSRSPMIRLQPRNESHRATVLPCERVAGLYRAVYRYHRVDEE